MAEDIDARKLSRCSASALRRLAAFLGLRPTCACPACSSRLVDRLRREMARIRPP